MHLGLCNHRRNLDSPPVHTMISKIQHNNNQLAKKIPAAVICEIMNEDGTMSKGEDLFKFAKKHSLKIAKIDDLIAYRLKKEKLIKLKKKSNIEVKGKKFY